MNQHFFDVPFAFSGDKTAIPDPLQSGGTVSFTEGWNYNYQRNLSTDPAALPIDRSTTNWLFNQITIALQALQQTGVPEFILSSQNGGVAYPYGLGAVVLWSASGNAPFQKFVSLTAGNVQTPSAGDPLGTTTGWQVVCDPIATSAQASAGTNNASIMTPALVQQQTALRALLAGASSQVFNVGPATAGTHAPQLQQVQQNAFNYAGAAGGTANALTATLAPAPTSYTDDLVVVVRVGINNTGATTLNLNGLGVKNVVGAAHAALQGGELVAGGFACFAYSTNLGNFVLLWTTGGAEQVGAAVAAQHAVTFGQLTGVVGMSRGIKASLAAAAASITISGEEIVVETALGGLQYKNSNWSDTFNGATTGAGGMDTGALPTSGYVGIYRIYNPTTNTWKLLGTNASSGVVANIYGGANMPSGYTASALVAILPTTAGALINICELIDRKVSFPQIQGFQSVTAVSSPTLSSAIGAIPPNALTVDGQMQCNLSINAGTSVQCAVYEDAQACGVQQAVVQGPSQSFNNIIANVTRLKITQGGKIYYSFGTTGGGTGISFNILIAGFTF